MHRKSKLSDLTSTDRDQNFILSKLLEGPIRRKNIKSEKSELISNTMLQIENSKYEEILETAVNDFKDDSKNNPFVKSQTLLNNYFSNYHETSFEVINSNPLHSMLSSYEKSPSESDFSMIEFSLASNKNRVKGSLKQGSFEVKILTGSPVSTETNCSFRENCSQYDLLNLQMSPLPERISDVRFHEKDKTTETFNTNANMLNKNPLSKDESNLNHYLVNSPCSNKNVRKEENSLKRYFNVIKIPNTQSLNHNKSNDHSLEQFTASKKLINHISENNSFCSNQLINTLDKSNNTKINHSKGIDYEFINKKGKLISEPVITDNHVRFIETKTSSSSETITAGHYSDDFIFPLYSNTDNNVLKDPSHTLTNRESNQQNISTHSFNFVSSNLQFNGILHSTALLETDQIFQEGLKQITEDRYLLYNPLYDNIPEYTNKEFILNQIEKIFCEILTSFIKNECEPSFRIRCFKWSNCKFINDKLKLKNRQDSRYITVKYKSAISQAKFNIIVYILGKCYSLLQKNSFCTKREIYYQIVNYVDSQGKIDDAVNSVSCLLGVPPWELGVLASSKGLAYGDLVVTLISGDTISFSNKGGTLIPQNPTEIATIKTNASFILVIEKDSVYQKLLDENCHDKLAKSFVLVTGKGYPDINTRIFLKILWMKSSKPAFILTDADPDGIDIMLTYRFGSLNSSHLSDYLALPSLRWLGVHPSEIISYDIKSQSLSLRDHNKIKSLLDRPYFYAGSNSKIKKEIKKLQEKNVKAEIEGIMKTDSFLSDVYLPNKFFTRNFI